MVTTTTQARSHQAVQESPDPPGAREEGHVVIVENNPGWRASHRLAFEEALGPDLTFHEAPDGVTGLATVRQLQGQGIRPRLISIDLHMGSPEQNGDQLVAELVDDELPLAVVSGTLTLERKNELNEGVGGIRFVSKDGLGVISDPHERARALARIRQFADTPHPALDTETLAYLYQVAGKDMNIEGIKDLVDAIKGTANSLLRRYAEVVDRAPALDFLKVEGLYQGDVGYNVHEFKNGLVPLIGTVVEQQAVLDIPDTLIEELTVFQSFVNLTFVQLKNDHDNVDIALSTRTFCRRLDRISPTTVTYDEASDDLEVEASPLIVNALLSGSLYNAVLHGVGEIGVRVHDGAVTVTNRVDADTSLPFSIVDNEINGDLPQTSTLDTGSGTGLRAMLAQVQATPGVTMSLEQQGNEVVTTLRFAAPLEAENVIGSGPVVRVERNKVVLLCHDGDPELSLSGMMSSNQEQVQFQPLETPHGIDSYVSSHAIDVDIASHKKKEAEVLAFLEENQSTFEDAFLCILHVSKGGLTGICPTIHARFPHLVLIPVSNYPEYLYDSDNEAFTTTQPDWIPPTVFTMDHVRKFYQPDDAPDVEDLALGLYYTFVRDDRWEALLKIAKRMSDSLAGGDVHRHDSSDSPASVEESTAVTRVEGGVMFLCHDALPEMTYQRLLEEELPGVAYHTPEAPLNFDSYDRTGRIQEEVRQFLDRNEQAFSECSLCMIHTRFGGFDNLLPLIQERFPHVVLLPVSTELIPTWYEPEQDEFVDISGEVPDAVLRLEDVREHLLDTDPAPLDEIANGIYQANPSPEVWETLLRIARRVSNDRRNS